LIVARSASITLHLGRGRDRVRRRRPYAARRGEGKALGYVLIGQACCNAQAEYGRSQGWQPAVRLQTAIVLAPASRGRTVFG